MRRTTMSCLAMLLGAVFGSVHAAEPLFEETEVFVGGHDNINTYRIPSMVCSRNGTVLVFCEGRRDNNIDGSPTHLVLKRGLGNAVPWTPPRRKGPVPDRRGRDRNITWQPLQILMSSNGEEAYMNPVPVIDRTDGTILLLVNHHSRYQPEGNHYGRVLLLTSKDDGATWSAPIDVTPETGRKELGPGIGIQTENGRFVIPTYEGVIFSDDHGKSWKAGGKTPGPVNESQVVELSDGSLMLHTRSTPNRTAIVSRDGGMTWGKPWKDPALTDPAVYDGCQASVIRYTKKGGNETQNRLLFSHPADPKYRFHMTVRISYDEGKTWPVSKLIKKGTAAYSSLTVFPDGTIGLVYETGNNYGDIVEYYAKISFARFNLEWLTDGQDSLAKR